MNEPYVVLNFYKEQRESLFKLMAEIEKAGFLSHKEHNATYENAMRLKVAVQDNMQFLITSIIIKDYKDGLSYISEFNMLKSILLNEDFLWLLAKNSLTNRIIKGCETKMLSEGVVYRIRECIIAFLLLIAT